MLCTQGKQANKRPKKWTSQYYEHQIMLVVVWWCINIFWPQTPQYCILVWREGLTHVSCWLQTRHIIWIFIGGYKVGKPSIVSFPLIPDSSCLEWMCQHDITPMMLLKNWEKNCPIGSAYFIFEDRAWNRQLLFKMDVLVLRLYEPNNMADIICKYLPKYYFAC